MDLGIVALLREWGPAGLSGIFVILIYLGLFESRRAINRMVRQYEQALTDAREREKEWRKVAQTQQETIALQAKQIGESVEQGKITVALLESIAKAAGVPGSGRHRDGR